MAKLKARFTRHAPNARYRRLLELYREMHVRGEVIRGVAPEVRAYTKGVEKDVRLGNSPGRDTAPVCIVST